MPCKVLILGGYGNFGKRIARLLTQARIPVILAGRDEAKAQACAATLPPHLVEIHTGDVIRDLTTPLTLFKPRVVINTCGPFQTANYDVMRTCIAHGAASIDLADGRDFVTRITQLDALAKQHNGLVISGASTVPALSSAVLEHIKERFSTLDTVRFGIAPGQKAERGLATTEAILGYVGKRLAPCAGHRVRYGWQDLYRQSYPVLGSRWMANCDVPDLDLLPPLYGLSRISFSAGMENPLVHLGIWALSWLVRLKFPLHPERHAKILLRASHWFDASGSDDGGMHMLISGKDHNGKPMTLRWFIVARGGDGPYIPTIPAVILTKKILTGFPFPSGAYPCVGLVSLEEYLAALEDFKVETFTFTDMM